MKSKRIKKKVNLGIMPEIINPCEIVDFSQLPNIDFSFGEIEIEELELEELELEIPEIPEIINPCLMLDLPRA